MIVINRNGKPYSMLLQSLYGTWHFFCFFVMFLFRCSAPQLWYLVVCTPVSFHHDISNSIIQPILFISLDLTVAYSIREQESITAWECLHLFFVRQTICLLNARARSHFSSCFFSSSFIRFSSFLFGHANGVDWNVKWLKSIERVCAFFTVNRATSSK